MNKEVWLYNMTWQDIKENLDNGLETAIIPVGSVEQHGPHLPLGTDTYVAITLAESVALEANAVVAPPVWCGFSPHHMVLPGTITIRPEVLIEFVYDMAESLIDHGFKNIVLLNGHRIVNISWMQIAAERIKRKLKAKVVVCDPSYLSKEIVPELGWGKIGHADAIESSHMWNRYPELVKMERAADFEVPDSSLYHVDPASHDDTMCYVPSSYEEASRHISESLGVAGCPSQSDQDKGGLYHKHIVKRLVSIIENFS